ncbi:sulfite exporter TauE/SafE family protein [Alkalinema pantanalense CENA528]|uniref:sulfite exporter TauE/SafE family protein n=1 Tax=Alkalinema pantanalense TaxID=1620705 RepID=UPI003D6E56FE
MDPVLLIPISFCIGIIVGLTGIGGASLITPMLIFLFQVPPSVAVSSDVVAATLMKIVGGIKHWRQQTLDLQVVKWLALGSVPGSLGGVAFLHQVREIEGIDTEAVLLRFIGMAILMVTIVSLIQLMLLTFAPEFQLPDLPKIDLSTVYGKAFSVLIGALLGCIVGLTSVSSGAMFALVLVMFFQLDARKLVGTDLAQAAILLTFTSLGHLSLGTVQWGIVIPIWIGSVPGALLGAKLCQLAPQKPLRFAVYLLLVAVSWKLAYAA